MDIQSLPRQNQAEELVTAGTDGVNLADGLIIGIDRHKAGDAALDLDLKQDVRLGQAALGAGRHNVVDHNGRDALALGVVRALGLTGQDVGLIGGQRRLGGGGGLRCGAGRGGGGGGQGISVLFAGCQQHRQGEQRRNYKQNTFHSIAPFSSFRIGIVVTYYCSLFVTVCKDYTGNFTNPFILLSAASSPPCCCRACRCTHRADTPPARRQQGPTQGPAPRFRIRPRHTRRRWAYQDPRS